jgi:hypothetical protein
MTMYYTLRKQRGALSGKAVLLLCSKTAILFMFCPENCAE